MTTERPCPVTDHSKGETSPYVKDNSSIWYFKLISVIKRCLFATQHLQEFCIFPAEILHVIWRATKMVHGYFQNLFACWRTREGSIFQKQNRKLYMEFCVRIFMIFYIIVKIIRPSTTTLLDVEQLKILAFDSRHRLT